MVAHAGHETGRQLLPDDPVLTCMCLFDAGLVSDFCDARGPLLPPDELALLREWAEVYAGAYEVVEVEPGIGMQLLDLTTGDRHEVVEHTATRTLQPGDVLLIVPYPDGTTRMALGGVEIPVARRSSLLALLDQDPSAGELADWYGRLYTPRRGCPTPTASR